MKIHFVAPLIVLAAVTSLSAAEAFKGRIVKLDASIGKVVLTHGAIPKLDMPAGMTMGYHVADKAMLEGLKPGDTVSFDAKDDGGSYTITALKKAK